MYIHYKNKRYKLKLKNILLLLLIPLIIVGGFFIFSEDQNEKPGQYVPEYQEIGTTETLLIWEDYLKVSAHYPKVGNKQIDDYIYQFIEKEVEKFKKDAAINQEEALMDEFSAVLTIKFNSFRFNKDIISIDFNVLSSLPYTAHPETTQYNFVFSLDDSKLLTTEDIFKGDYLYVLREKTITKFLEDPKYSSIINEQELYQKLELKDEIFSNFLITKEALVLFFPRYELFPGYVGEPRVVIPYSEIKENMNIGEYTALPDKDNNDFKPNVPKKEIDPNKPMVALTFDDGPHHENTVKILDSLKKYNANATFFVLGNRIKGNYDILQRMVNEGNEIGNHSYSHPLFTTLGINEIEQELKLTQDLVYDATKIYPKIVRPPYGGLNQNIKDQSKFPFILWSVDTLDWKHKDKNYIYNHVLDQVKNGDIILMHDLYTSSADAAEMIIKELTKQGYQFVTISQLLQIKYGTVEVGKTYSK